MKDKRNIDELFKSQMGDFKASPSPEVWNRIEAQLKKKEDRKVIPLWWKLGGVAALIALLITVGSSLFTSDPEQPLVTNDPSLENPLEGTPKNDMLIQQDREGIVEGQSTSQDIGEESEGTRESSSSNVQTITKNSELAETPLEPSNATDKNKKAKLSGDSQRRTSDVAKSDTPIQKRKAEEPLKEGVLPSEQKEVQTGIAKNESETPKSVDPMNKDKEISPSILKEETGIAQEDTEAQQQKAEVAEKQKKSIFDAIEENKKDALAQTEKQNQGGWEVTPNVGPVYYNSVNGGSSIDPMFADNSQSGEVNFSYGVQVAYVINDRFSIRSGVNNVNVGYSTGGIEVASGPQAFGLKSVNYDNPGRNVLTVFDKGTVPATVDPNDPYAQLNLKSTTGNAELRQSINYYEIPLEAKYALVNKRFGINMIGGFSTLLLGDSEVSVNDNGFRSVLGEANNLNSVSFSTNIGLGFDYKISKRFKLNLEPIFKYQLNPYSESSVDFNPYYFGIYSGLSFKF